ncbi:BQ5605_C039g11769 [Microbotryum silenes-dioicae]|uniref:BQ5605_C039g11769 protein n=1 Tax=Microbotryum silenes-dioicae TaxID=796604 RepID=A0A2X0P9S2_9BASI|nr:BQ5605_C039g11769 [Microbotryum silenes-dioicae]
MVPSPTEQVLTASRQKSVKRVGINDDPEMINKIRRTAGPGVEPGSLPSIGKVLTN